MISSDNPSMSTRTVALAHGDQPLACACPLDTCRGEIAEHGVGVRTFDLIMACSTGHGSPAL